MLRLAIRAVVLALTVVAVPSLAFAQTIPKTKGPTRIIGLFDFLCLKQLPDLNGIERAAGFGEFDQLTGEDLAPHAPDGPTQKLFAWRYHDHGERFILTAWQAKPDDDFKKQTPAFADATKTACSLRVPSTRPDVLLGELTRVMGRGADQSWQEGPTHVYAWTHKRPDALSYVHYRVPENAGGTAVLSASVFVKN